MAEELYNLMDWQKIEASCLLKRKISLENT